MAEAAPLGCWVPQRACPIWGQSCSIWGQRGSVWGQSCRLGTELPSLGTKPLQSHAGMSPSCAFLESDEINVRVAARLATSFFSCCKSEAEPRSGDQFQVKALLVCQQRRRESLQQDDARSLWRSRRPWTHHGETRGPAGHQVLSATVLTCLSRVLPLVAAFCILYQMDSGTKQALDGPLASHTCSHFAPTRHVSESSDVTKPHGGTDLNKRVQKMSRILDKWSLGLPGDGDPPKALEEMQRGHGGQGQLGTALPR